MRNVKGRQAINQRKQNRVRLKIKQSTRPRLSVFRSNKAIYAQIIDDNKHQTLFSVSAKEVGKAESKTQTARAVGKLLAEKAKKASVTEVVFDRGEFAYHGRVKALAEGAREGGLQF